MASVSVCLLRPMNLIIVSSKPFAFALSVTEGVVSWDIKD